MGGGGGVDGGILTAQMGQLQLSGAGYSGPPRHTAQYHLPASQYAGGWAISHGTPPTLSHTQVSQGSTLACVVQPLDIAGPL